MVEYKVLILILDNENVYLLSILWFGVKTYVFSIFNEKEDFPRLNPFPERIFLYNW